MHVFQSFTMNYASIFLQLVPLLAVRAPLYGTGLHAFGHHGCCVGIGLSPQKAQELSELLSAPANSLAQNAQLVLSCQESVTELHCYCFFEKQFIDDFYLIFLQLFICLYVLFYMNMICSKLNKQKSILLICIYVGHQHRNLIQTDLFLKGGVYIFIKEHVDKNDFLSLFHVSLFSIL